jgi:hypothetical protein
MRQVVVTVILGRLKSIAMVRVVGLLLQSNMVSAQMGQSSTLL